MESPKLRGNRALAVLLTLVAWNIPSIGSGQQPSSVPKYDQWRLVAQSDLILKAELSAPVDAIRTAVASRRYSVLRLHAKVTEALKGRPDSTDIEFAYYPEPVPYSPSPQAVISLDRKQALIFLQQADTPTVAGLYFAGDTPKSLQAMDPAIIRRVQEEYENQWRVIAAWGRSKDAQPDAQQKKVQALIQQMLDKRTEQTAFKRMERMGQAAVPSMIRLMDDRRPLPIPYIDLENKFPGAFEGIRHYAAGEVVDALAALLNQITGEDFGPIYNGGSERERAKAVTGWRIYLHYRLGKSASTSRSHRKMLPARG
jgi:hypothetical protein